MQVAKQPPTKMHTLCERLLGMASPTLYRVCTLAIQKLYSAKLQQGKISTNSQKT